MLDLLMAFVHHLLAFALLGIIVAELILLRGPMNASAVRAVSRIDMGFGIDAGLLLIVGFLRAILAAKGWPYYSHNVAFWAKIAVFALIGLVSVMPTMRIIAWRRHLKNDPAALPALDETAFLRRLIAIELLLFVPLPLLAAAMARGYGALTP